MYLLLALLCFFVYQIGGLYCATYAFVLFLLTKVKVVSIDGKYSRRNLKLVIMFLFWAVVSLACFSIDYRYFDNRNLSQFAFNLFYIFLVFDIRYDYQKFNRSYVFATLVFSVYIIIMYVWKSSLSGLMQVFADRNWGNNYIVGFSNSTGLPILYGMYIFLKEQGRSRIQRILFAIISTVAIILTTSRAVMLGAFAINVYFFAIRGRKISFKGIIALSVLSLAFLAFLFFWTKRDTLFANRILVTWDREEIFRATIDYVKRRPILGYGGNTFDVIYKMFGSSVASKNWLHTHNTILELLLRYGFVGLVIFSVFVVNLVKKAETPEARYMLILLWSLSLTQLFFRNEIFIIMIFFIIQEPRQKRYERLLNEIKCKGTNKI